MYDLLIRGGEVIDPGQGLRGVLDVAIQKNRIAQVAEGIGAGNAKEVISAQGKIVTPGLIDLHVHVYNAGLQVCVPPDRVGVKSGVTTLVDAGSAGSATFGGFANSVIPAAVTSVFCFLNICATGLLNFEIYDRKEIDIGATTEVAQRYPELIKGIKILLHGPLVRSNGLELFKIAKKIATENKLRLMVHIGDPNAPDSWDLTGRVLPLLEQGDILSHIFTANPGRVISRSGMVLPEFMAARERGVILDVAHGTRNFCFEVAERALEQGIVPSTISTDLTTLSIFGPVYSLAETMSKFVILGLDITEVIKMTTINPARALGMDSRLGGLKVGAPADVSIFELKDCEKEFVDSVGDTRQGRVALIPLATIKSGQVIYADPFPSSGAVSRC